MYINRKGIAIAAAGIVLLAGGIYYSTGPSYLSNPVVTATVTACKGKGPDRYCVGTWPGGHGSIEDAKPRVNERLRVRPKSDHAATVRLNPSVINWIVRELISAALVAGAVAVGVHLFRRRRRYLTENPDQLPELSPDPQRAS